MIKSIHSTLNNGLLIEAPSWKLPYGVTTLQRQTQLSAWLTEALGRPLQLDLSSPGHWTANFCHPLPHSSITLLPRVSAPQNLCSPGAYPDFEVLKITSSLKPI